MGLKSKYTFHIEDSSRLVSVYESQRPLWIWLVAGAIGLSVLIILSIMIICLTPIRNALPGYMKDAQRESTIDNLMRLDSLKDAYEANMAYINNVFTVFDTDRESSDSASLSVNTNRLSPDSLLPASSSEKAFVKMMQEREKYNISVLTPLAAEGWILSPVATEAFATEASKDAYKAIFVVPTDAPVSSVADGTILDTHYSPQDKGYTILIQHDKGFVSRYSRIGRLLVSQGERVNVGEAIGISAAGDARSHSRVALEMWRNGDALIPAKLLSRTVKTNIGESYEE